ncbi:hypothetical protein WDJ51_02530 [Rathayibacter sp. YIM 133350]|uniref:hypothetical protein n=1 Tax=Rathayibacter sp. YIM 133350 TaxID=3131992 RepID=UPI00307F9D77
MARTVQLRRYELKPALVEEFLEWWPSTLVPAREALGFQVEFGYFNAATNEFTWAVSVDGDAAEFERIEQAYLASPEREAAFAGRGPWTDVSDISLVTPLDWH